MTPSTRSRRSADVLRVQVAMALGVLLAGFRSGAGARAGRARVDPEAKRLAERGLEHYEAGPLRRGDRRLRSLLSDHARARACSTTSRRRSGSRAIARRRWRHIVASSPRIRAATSGSSPKRGSRRRRRCAPGKAHDGPPSPARGRSRKPVGARRRRRLSRWQSRPTPPAPCERLAPVDGRRRRRRGDRRRRRERELRLARGARFRRRQRNL